MFFVRFVPLCRNSCPHAWGFSGLARILQALGGSGAIVLARAIVRDLYAAERAGRELSQMGAMIPRIGGLPGQVLCEFLIPRRVSKSSGLGMSMAVSGLGWV